MEWGCARAQPTQQSISLTPTRGGAFTPQKLMLAQRERRMNMLSPGDGRSLFNADIETGKVVAEWAFQKDGVDVGMKDIVNETRAAQLDDRDTFLGLGANRRAPCPAAAGPAAHAVYGFTANPSARIAPS